MNIVMFMISKRSSHFATILFVLFGVGSVRESTADAQSLKRSTPLQMAQEKHRKRFHKFSEDIKKLASECDDQQLSDEANEVRSRDFAFESQSFHTSKLPVEIRYKTPPNSVENWQKQLRRLETEYSRDLFKQAKVLATQGFPGYAYNLIREAALHDPDSEPVRKILGFVRNKNEWVTPFAANQMRENKIWHEDFGWLPKEHVERYIGGERFTRKSGWITVEKEKMLRADFNSAWEVRTDHYLIKTNVSLEKGVELGKALEDFYGVFHEIFAGFFQTPEQLQKLFEGKGHASRADAIPHTVHFYKSRDEYVDRLGKLFPTIAVTNGVYLTSDRVAHFYDDPRRDNQNTLFHEATHQLFYESDRSTRAICANHHFWIIEGIACYMESFERGKETFALGNVNHIRFVGARRNLLRLNYYVPLHEFTSFGMQEYQNAPEPILAKNYTQAAGLARFFMNYDNGRYREALVAHLSQLYSGNQQICDHAEGLDILTGVEFTELDRQYSEDVRALEEQNQKNLDQ